MSDFFKTSKALNVISSRFPIGVETIYKFFEVTCIMRKSFLATSLLLIFNFNLFADENNKSIRIGLLAPLTGTYGELGNSLIYSFSVSENIRILLEL